MAVGFTDTTNPQKPFPRSTDYFVVRGEQAQAFTERYGDKPTRLSIRFATDNSDFSCSECYELRDATGKLFGFGDGQEFWFYSRKDKAYSTHRNLGSSAKREIIHRLEKKSVLQTQVYRENDTLIREMAILDRE